MQKKHWEIRKFKNNILILCSFLTFICVVFLYSLYKSHSQYIQEYNINQEFIIEGAIIKIKQATLRKPEKKTAVEKVRTLRITGYVTITDSSKFPQYSDFQKTIEIFLSTQEGIYNLFENSMVSNVIRPIVIEKDIPLGINKFKIVVFNKQTSTEKELSIKPVGKAKGFSI